MVIKVVQAIKRHIENIRVKKAVKKANKLFQRTGRKYLVLWYDGKPIVISKKELKILIDKGVFKGISIQEIQKKAIYKTR